MNTSNLDYWNQYYDKGAHGTLVPSQFAAFVLNEYQHYAHFIDVGCGNGRDSFFFANLDKTVLALDGSEKAINNNSAFAQTNQYKSTIQFRVCDFASKASVDSIIKNHSSLFINPVIYSRFFLHAINDDEVDNFLDFVAATIGADGVLCIEYRTDSDEQLDKVTEPHFRNFIKTEKLEEKLKARQLQTQYFCEGRGYAKYKNDDAFVARHIIQRS